MNIMEIVNPILAIGSMGLLFGVGLGIASKKFAVPVDERVSAIRDQLPGANCGGCGFAGCDAFSKAVANGEAKTNGCPVSSDEQKAAIAEIMGATNEVGAKQVAIVRCQGTMDKAKLKYNYEGIESCEDAHLVGNGPKGCAYGCLGFGSCVKACPFDALTIENGLATVDEAKCKACSACVAACPRHLIYIGQSETKYQVKCMSHDKGKNVKTVCEVGCIGCGLCLKQCEVGAIKLENALATIDADLCIGCGKCVSKCPTHALVVHNL
ncbi:RnfABCDGE type electron transport complex subunit B [Niameybacter massiliensis]|uniref:Ion-translocating oxidoreductase complex subunit B n=1 Tax=Holtiella tumoricola TaxID=3018743 RepID=A0AA42DR28_9FIRM|nr:MULTISPECIES: RnfABCDGE type electron transport complex subunit B [Lachnospirales]MDA3733660.1 RnfABCDGE type electron transport complex subunit B [Holtiella tumoricola]